MKTRKKSDEVLKLTRQEISISSSILNKQEGSASVPLCNSKQVVMKPGTELELCRQRNAATQNVAAKYGCPWIRKWQWGTHWNNSDICRLGHGRDTGWSCPQCLKKKMGKKVTFSKELAKDWILLTELPESYPKCYHLNLHLLSVQNTLNLGSCMRNHRKKM